MWGSPRQLKTLAKVMMTSLPAWKRYIGQFNNMFTLFYIFVYKPSFYTMQHFILGVLPTELFNMFQLYFIYVFVKNSKHLLKVKIIINHIQS